MQPSSFRIVGTSPRRIDGVAKVTGSAKFTGDLALDGLLVGKVLRSPLPHAAIVSIDVSRAEALPDVAAVLTRADLTDIDPFFGHCLRDRPLIAIDRVRYIGEPVAIVAAETEEAANEALSSIEVRYEELTVLSTVSDALAEGAPLLHENVAGVGEFHEMGGVGDQERSNVCHHERFNKGDIAAGFGAADEIIEETYEFPMIYHYTMEPHTTIARVTSDRITLWTSSAHPFLIRSEIAHMFSYPHKNVEVIVPFVGGAYGGKSYFKIEPMVVAVARKTSGRPVRIAQNLAESMLTIRRHSAKCRIKSGVKRDGSIVAREAEVIMDTGAYADNGPRVAKRVANRVHGPYDIEHCKIDVVAVYTNTVPAGSMRSIGGPQSIWPLESHMDSIAEKLDIDALELRRKNLLRFGQRLRDGAKPIDANLRMGIEKAAAGIGWGGRNTEIKERALGLAVGVTDSEAMPVSVALIRLLADGSAIVLAGSTEVGQGTRTILCQIAAEELRIPADSVVMHGTDTDYTPFDRSTGASRSTTVMGNAVKAAAADLRKQLLDAAAEVLNTSTDTITLSNGEVIAGDKRISYGKLVGAYFGMPGGELIGRGYIRPGGGMDHQLPVFWETGMGAVDLTLDQETGAIELNKYVSVADVGKAIHPEQCHGQDEGAAVQGFGHTLFESMIYDAAQLLNPNLIDYRVPRFTDLPKVFQSELVENQDGPGPYGAKGMGESGIVSVAPAVGNALYNATGARVRELPLTPERVWRALRDRKRGQ